jgi:hypothetical protein
LPQSWPRTASFMTGHSILFGKKHNSPRHRRLRDNFLSRN